MDGSEEILVPAAIAGTGWSHCAPGGFEYGPRRMTIADVGGIEQEAQMEPVMRDLSFRAHADALFASGLQRCDEPGAGKVRQAVAEAIRAFGYSGCAGRVAQEFGDHPEAAVARMLWARAVISEAFTESLPEPGPGADAVGSLVVRPRLPGERASCSPFAERRERTGSLAGGMIVSSRRRLLAHLRAGNGEGAALEMEKHLRVLLYMWRLARGPAGAMRT